MNDLMSVGLHRLWKRVAIESIAIRSGMQILDLASGTGDLARAMSRRAGSGGHVVLADINDEMLRVGRDRCIDHGELKGLSWCQCDAETLPYPDQSFDRVTIGFGLRNVTDKDAALREMRRVLKPGGRGADSRVLNTRLRSTRTTLRRVQLLCVAERWANWSLKTKNPTSTSPNRFENIPIRKRLPR